jgi:hypothetical protein
MRLTVVGGCGAWPAAGQACSGYLVEQDGFRLLIDPGYAIVPRLPERIDATEVMRSSSVTATPTTAPTCTRCYEHECSGRSPRRRCPCTPCQARWTGSSTWAALGRCRMRSHWSSLPLATSSRSARSRSRPDSCRIGCPTPASGWRQTGRCWPIPATLGRAPPSLSWPAAPTCTRDSAWLGRGCRPRHLHRRGRGRPRRPRRRPWTLTGLRAQLRSGAAGGC